jgi:N,N'-diacetyl-8-epilegionaminate cytidylyltransferase
MKYIALICAREGSKGLPGKNIKLLDGVPLIGRSIQIAKNIEKISRIVVSTDSKEIASIALEYGAEVPFMRPKELALDSSSEWDVWRHAINYLEKNEGEKLDALVVLPVTSPLKVREDVDNCIDLFEKGEVDSVITVSEAYRNPYFNMTIKDDNNYSSLVIHPKNKITRRQDAPKVYDMTTVAYVVDVNFIKNNNGIFEGKVKSVTIPLERSIDIDTKLDFIIAECIIKNTKERWQ